MGKIRIKTLGDEEKEKKQKERDSARREGKKISKIKSKTKDGVVEMAAEDLAPTSIAAEPELKETPKKQVVKKGSRARSRAYLRSKTFIDKTKPYVFNEALNLVKKTNLTGFDASVELHINTLEKGVKGSVNLPFGVGKKLRVLVANDKILGEIESGKLNFDVLITHPSYMAKLAKFAKILGPKGLMPNPKNGTISDKPEETAQKFGDSLHFKTEPDFPIMHLVIGKLSMEDEKLNKNFETIIKAIGETKIKSVFLKSTMSPSVRVQLG